MKWLRSPFLIPVLFLLYHYKLWTGVQTLAADTGDGIGAFKFFSILPYYWNWYEAAGQPYWTEMAIYRLQDPLMWPFVLFVKVLPVNPLIQFNLFILLRMGLLGVGFYYLLKTLKCRDFSAQLGTLIAMFGSAIPIMFRSIGALDLLTGFVGLMLFGLKFIQTGKRVYGFLVLLVLLHESITYHILYLVPIALVLLPTYWKHLLPYKKQILIGALIFGAALSAEFLAVKDPSLLPALRSMRYGTWVDAKGKVVQKEVGVGESVLSSDNLKAVAEDCGTRFSCRYYSVNLLKTFLLSDSAWSLTGYISFAGIGLLLISFLFIKRWDFRMLHTIGILTFVLSLGGATPLWGFLQKILPVLGFVRHTGFYFHLFVLVLCCLSALALNEFQDRMSKGMRPVLFLIVFVDLLAFQRLYVAGFLNFAKEGQLEKIDSRASERFESRILRVYNPYLIPRSSAATVYGTPSVLEPIFVQDQITEDHLKRGEHPRHFGFITLFISKPMAQLRVKLGNDLNAFKERVGVTPFGVLTSTNERREPRTLEIKGENLISSFTVARPTTMYLAVPFETIHSITVNGKPTPFTSSEGGYGVLFSSDEGPNSVEIEPKLGRRNLIYSLYYGAYFFFLWLAFHPEKFLSRIFRETSFNLSDLLSRTRASSKSFT